MTRKLLVLALAATVALPVGLATAADSTPAAVTLPAAVTADRAKVSADYVAVANARAQVLGAVGAGDAAAVASASAAYLAARVALDADLVALRDDALPILRQDEGNLADDRIALEICGMTNDTTACAAARQQLDADRAQAHANREAIFGNLCPPGYLCAKGPGPVGGPPPGGPGFGPGTGADRPRRGP